MWRLKVTADASEIYAALAEAFQEKHVSEEDVPGTGGRQFRSVQAAAENPESGGLRTIQPTTRAVTEPGVSEQFRCVQKSLQAILGQTVEGRNVMNGQVTVTCSGEPGEKLSIQVEVG